MVGYGMEDNHFVVELTYNYGIKNYRKGNDFQVGFYYVSSPYNAVFGGICSISAFILKMYWRE